MFKVNIKITRTTPWTVFFLPMINQYEILQWRSLTKTFHIIIRTLGTSEYSNEYSKLIIYAVGFVLVFSRTRFFLCLLVFSSSESNRIFQETKKTSRYQVREFPVDSSSIKSVCCYYLCVYIYSSSPFHLSTTQSLWP